ncbi:BLOC-1-related complex subunit 5 [Manduca sexta]|uniref:BLOC-1-related complex subunit 5 n=1 Tax=Manduca sexta TaxID=7130 RepID=A0A921YRE4_MANSE|nr:BLOC-1-related complex subunit 5 [Manduca sexta]KAG6443939.1 hypothetical protein O3G_MSEX003110 [Manduca sexta]KAG6443940.1 hypothetical protein O3G_MSEX003110 [Manduca sexta]
MGSEQSSVPPKKQSQRAPLVRRGHTIAVSNVQDGSKSDTTTSGNNSPGASVCSDSELPYISYTVDRPIGDSPKTLSKSARAVDKKSLQRRHTSAGSAPQRRGRRVRDIVVVKKAADEQLDEDIRRLQEIPTFLPIMRGTLGLPGARDPEVLEGLDYKPWVRLTTRLQAHLAACAHPLAAEELSLAAKIKETETEAWRIHSALVERQRNNARHAERLARAHQLAHHLSRSRSLLEQTLQDIEELNNLLPEDKRLEPFVWNEETVTSETKP